MGVTESMWEFPTPLLRVQTKTLHVRYIIVSPLFDKIKCLLPVCQIWPQTEVMQISGNFFLLWDPVVVINIAFALNEF